MSIIIVIFIMVLLYAFMVSPSFRKRNEMEAYRNMWWAHRGLHDINKGVPENSMAAFRRALEANVGIELDLHMTKDGQVVVFHDEDLLRMCGEAGEIGSYTMAELSQKKLLQTSETIPSFQEVLDLVAGKVPLLIELKLISKDMQLCEKVADILRSYQGDFLIQSFNTLGLRWFRKNQPQILRGQIASGLTWSDSKAAFLLRFAVEHLLCNCLGRPHFISYKFKDRHNLGIFVTRFLMNTPLAVWTLRGDKAQKKARGRFFMYIYEEQERQRSPLRL